MLVAGEFTAHLRLGASPYTKEVSHVSRRRLAITKQDMNSIVCGRRHTDPPCRPRS